MIVTSFHVISLQVQYLGEEAIFSSVQVMSMMLEYLKGVASKALAKPVSDCVIAVSERQT